MANPQDKAKSSPAETDSGAGSGHDRMNPASSSPSFTDATHTRSNNPQPMSAQGAGQPIGDKLSDTASGIVEKAKETASGTYEAVTSQASNKIEERKGEFSTGLRTLANSFRKTG